MYYFQICLCTFWLSIGIFGWTKHRAKCLGISTKFKSLKEAKKTYAELRIKSPLTDKVMGVSSLIVALSSVGTPISVLAYLVWGV